MLGPGLVETFIDSTQDSYGSQEWIHMLCEDVEEDSGFLYGVSEGCRQIPLDEVVGQGYG